MTLYFAPTSSECRKKIASWLDDITVLLLTYNEAANIKRTLDRLRWAKRIIVVDSFSSDETCEIAREYENVELVQRHFDNHADQWSYGLERVHSEWVLSLDADYQITDSFVREIRTIIPLQMVHAYFARFKYCVHGQPLRATLYPPRAVLFRRSRCRFEQEGHTQVLRIDGQHGWLQSPVYHDDRKSLSHWLRAQDRYVGLEARHLLTASSSGLNFADRLRLWILPAPFLVFFYTLLVKGLILDGWPGWYYAFQRPLAEILLSLRLIETRFKIRNNAQSRSN